MKSSTIASTIILAAALFGLASCVTDGVDPDQGARDQRLLEEPAETCGSCQSSEASVSEDGSLDYCEPCDGTVSYRRCRSQAAADYYNCIPTTWFGRRVRSVTPSWAP